MDETSKELLKSAVPIVKELGYLALAIDQAGAYIAMGCRLEDYIQTFRNHRQELLKNPKYKGASRYNQAVYATWDISYKAIENSIHGREGNALESRDAKNALQILNLFAFLHNEGLMEEIYKRAAENTGVKYGSNGLSVQDSLAQQILLLDNDGVWDPFLFRRGISTLLSFSLIKQYESWGYFSMHVLVHLWAQDRLSGSAHQSQLRSARALLSRSITRRFLTQDYSFRRKLLPHITACQKHGSTSHITDIEGAEQAHNYALVFREAGQWNQAEELRVQVMETRKRVLGEEHIDTLASMNDLASIYLGQGQWKKAEELLMQVIETSKRVLGQEHPDTLTSMNNLALAYLEQRQLKKAEELFVQVLKTKKRVFGQEHPKTLISMNNLASTYLNQGQLKKAEERFVQVMKTEKRVLGQEHPGTLTSINNLASIYLNQEQLKKAEELFVQVIETSKRVLGQEHPKTLISMNNLAWTLKYQGRSDEALELMTVCVQLSMEKLGENHPDTKDRSQELDEWSQE